MTEPRIPGASPDCAAIFSGGLDSTTLVYQLLAEGFVPHLISFNYGQRHNKELDYAQNTAHKLRLKHNIIDLTNITHLISNSALTSVDRLRDKAVDSGTVEINGQVHEWIEVPEGHYAEDNMKQTVVPNRNMIMLSIAAGVAVNSSYRFIATGVHAGDHFVYPDCRPEFIEITNAAIMSGNRGFGPFNEYGLVEGHEEDPFIRAPFLSASKADIAYAALQLGVPLEDTWSCYKGGEKHCGKCGTCVERLEAIDEAERKYNWGLSEDEQVHDKTKYEDKDFWRQAVASR